MCVLEINIIIIIIRKCIYFAFYRNVIVNRLIVNDNN
jgi:hypothetical protein